MSKNNKIFVDIDNTITITIGCDYKSAIPIKERIDKINRYYDNGYHIVYWTSRGVESKIDYKELTENQLISWGCKYHELRLDKPVYTAFVDDLAIEPENFFNI